MDFRHLGYKGFLYDDLYTLEDHFRYVIKEVKDKHGLDITNEHLELLLIARDITMQRKMANNERILFQLIGSFENVVSKTKIYDIYSDLMFAFEEDNKRSPIPREQNYIWKRACKIYMDRLKEKYVNTNYHSVYFDINPRTGKLRKNAVKYEFSLSEPTIDTNNIN